MGHDLEKIILYWAVLSSICTMGEGDFLLAKGLLIFDMLVFSGESQSKSGTISACSLARQHPWPQLPHC